jgi:hypothetical protein
MAEALEIEQKAAEEKRLANEARAAAREAEVLGPFPSPAGGDLPRP